MKAPKAPLPFPSPGDDQPIVLQPQGWPKPRGYANGMMADGRIVVTGGVVGWDVMGNFPESFVAHGGYCFPGEHLWPARAPTADARQCRLGYICKPGRHPFDEPFFD